jgi:hypothetical protein
VFIIIVIEDGEATTAEGLAAIDAIAAFIIVVDGDDVAVLFRLPLGGLGAANWTLVNNAMSVTVTSEP